MADAKIRLFVDKPRSYYGLSRRAESIYSYLDRSARPEYAKIRDMLERWLNRLPLPKRDAVISRIRHKSYGSADENRRFNAEFFELFLHEFLTDARTSVTVDPNYSGKTPDFEVIEYLGDGSNLSYVVEATDIDLKRGTELERQWNELSAIDSLDELPIREFGLFLTTRGALDSTPRKDDLQRTFMELAQKADFEELLNSSFKEDYNFDDAPSATFEFGGWKATGRLMPVLPEYHQQPDGFVSIWSRGADHIDDIGRVKNRLYDKAKRYKNVEHLIVALRCDYSNRRLEEVLFGRRTFNFYFRERPNDTSPLPEPYHGQNLDGFWYNSSGPQNENVIGVVAFWEVHPWSLSDAEAVFYSNPYVDTRMPSWATEITHAEYSNGQIDIVDGLPPSAFLMDREVE